MQLWTYLVLQTYEVLQFLDLASDCENTDEDIPMVLHLLFNAKNEIYVVSTAHNKLSASKNDKNETKR